MLPFIILKYSLLGKIVCVKGEDKVKKILGMYKR